MIFAEDREFDVLAIGRAGVDFYAAEPGKDFNDVLTFERYVGGSPANISVALAKRGASVGFLGKISDDMLGRYVLHYFQKMGIDSSQMVTDSNRETRVTLAITETKAKDCGVVLYRNNAADISLDICDISENYIKKSKALLISGATLASCPSRDASLYAMALAAKHKCKIILDLDYRAYSWRSPEEVSLYYNLAAEKAHVLIGNREEFNALEFLRYSNNNDDERSARYFFDYCAEIVIIKHGEKGSKTFLKDGSALDGYLFTMPSILKPHGAGDSFAGNFIYELIQGNSVDRALYYAAAAAALVVSQHISCSEACPTTQELENFIKRYQQKEYQ